MIFQEYLIDFLVKNLFRNLKLYCLCLLSGICFINLNTLFSSIVLPNCSIQYLFVNGFVHLFFNNALYLYIFLNMLYSLVFMVFKGVPLRYISVVVLTTDLRAVSDLSRVFQCLGIDWSSVYFCKVICFIV